MFDVNVKFQLQCTNYTKQHLKVLSKWRTIPVVPMLHAAEILAPTWGSVNAPRMQPAAALPNTADPCLVPVLFPTTTAEPCTGARGFTGMHGGVHGFTGNIVNRLRGAAAG